ncbi:hypothetical protein [Glycomyces arizonensis]|uniref:hypothetical protein n=1 Tax=Glycomyces arizonensis TaxID=256035 RepID=UPI00041ABD8E|nr:hypothetical protein [Glycomyces arizonensis]
MSSSALDELDRLADAVIAVAGARHRIPLDRLLRETALNVLILTRIATNMITTGKPSNDNRTDEIDATCDRLADLLRQAARRLPNG